MLSFNLRVGYLICFYYFCDWVNHHTSSTLNVVKTSLVWRSYQELQINILIHTMNKNIILR